MDLRGIFEINPYNPDLPITVYTDASYTGGFGFVAGQSLPDGQFNVIQVGSTGLSPSQRNYSCYELELVGLSWAAKKAHHFLAYNPHPVTFRTDHASLSHLESVQLDSIKNPRILRFLEDLMSVNFRVEHVGIMLWQIT